MRKSLAALAGVFLMTSMAAAQEATPEAPRPIMATAYGTINVRGGPGAQYEIVGQLVTNDRITVDGRDSEDGDWLRVRMENGVVGWVASFAVLLNGDPDSLPIISADPPEAEGETVTVAAYGRVNVRGGPGMEHNIVGQLDVDDTAQVTGRSNTDNDWLYIENDEVQGWVAYFTVTIRGNPDSLPVLVLDGSGEGLASPDEVVAARFNVRLRDEPTSNGQILTVVPFESNVTPLARSEDGGWLYVLFQDVYGWGVTRLFDLSLERLDALPVYEDVLLPTPGVEATPEPEA